VGYSPAEAGAAGQVGEFRKAEIQIQRQGFAEGRVPADVDPQDLLNRWIVPMEKNIDFLALHTGRKIELPFNVLLVFCTNLPPADQVDEAIILNSFPQDVQESVNIDSVEALRYIHLYHPLRPNPVPSEAFQCCMTASSWTESIYVRQYKSAPDAVRKRYHFFFMHNRDGRKVYHLAS
jgi:hypothetical protein